MHFELLSPDPNHWRVNTYETDTAVYSGTHDNDTSEGWYKAEIATNEDLVNRVNWGAPPSGQGIGWDLCDLAWRSEADLAIAPVQDLLGLGSWARMNQPGTAWPQRPNWRWRHKSGDLTRKLAVSLERADESRAPGSLTNLWLMARRQASPWMNPSLSLIAPVMKFSLTSDLASNWPSTVFRREVKSAADGGRSWAKGLSPESNDAMHDRECFLAES